MITRDMIKNGALFKNRKTGNIYQVLRLAFHTEDDIEMVVYERYVPEEGKTKTYVRPLEGEAGFLAKFREEEPDEHWMEDGSLDSLYGKTETIRLVWEKEEPAGEAPLPCPHGRTGWCETCAST